MMNTNGRKDNIIDEILKDAHREIEPHDSWQALRTRIDHRISSKKSASIPATEMAKRLIFWRRLAFSMAACFLVTAGILIYFLGLNYGRLARLRLVTGYRGAFDWTIG